MAFPGAPARVLRAVWALSGWAEAPGLEQEQASIVIKPPCDPPEGPFWGLAVFKQVPRWPAPRPAPELEQRNKDVVMKTIATYWALSCARPMPLSVYGHPTRWDYYRPAHSANAEMQMKSLREGGRADKGPAGTGAEAAVAVGRRPGSPAFSQCSHRAGGRKAAPGQGVPAHSPSPDRAGSLVTSRSLQSRGPRILGERPAPSSLIPVWETDLPSSKKQTKQPQEPTN